MPRFWWRCIRAFSWLCVTAYYRSFRVEHPERIPMTGPVLFVVNHPNALLDGAAVLRAVPRPVAMAAKSTLFPMPVLGWILRRLGALPVHRPRDGTGRGRENLKMFAAFTKLFRSGGAALIFPEGVSHLDPELKEVKSGAARLSLDAEAEAGFALGLRLVPVGLQFEPESRFRGEVNVCIGEPFTVSDLGSVHRRYAIRTVQERIARSLRPLMLHLDDKHLAPLVRGVAGVYDDYQRAQPGPLEPRPRADVMRIAGACLNHFLVADPSAVETARKKLHRYERLSRRTGVGVAALASHDHPLRAWITFLGLAGLIVAGFPFYLLGALTGWLPYRATDVAARRAASRGDRVTLPVMRIAFGAIFFGVFWGALCTAVFFASGSAWFTTSFFALLVASGFHARRYVERVGAWRSRMKGLRPLVRPGIRRVASARDDLLRCVDELVSRYSESTGARLLPRHRVGWFRRVPWGTVTAGIVLVALAWIVLSLRGR